MISVQNVKKSFGPIQAVKGVSFTINQSEVVGFLGPNGAGKSTTMRMITGYLPPNSGHIEIAGLDLAEHTSKAQKHIGYLPESAAIYNDMEVTDFLLFMGRIRGLSQNQLKNRLKAVIEKCQLKKILGRKIQNISKGYRQRVGLAQALLHDPDILILDEPTVGLDPNQILEIRELIKEIGKTKTILLSTHILQEVSATCQRVIILNEGQIAAEGTPEYLTSGEMEQATYLVKVRGPEKTILEELKKLPGFTKAETKSSQQDLHEFVIHSAHQDDLSEEIFHLAVQNQWSLAKLDRVHMTLEDVFKKLTQ